MGRHAEAFNKARHAFTKLDTEKKKEFQLITTLRCDGGHKVQYELTSLHLDTIDGDQASKNRTRKEDFS
ncbi:hypothetical protein BaRGS_00014266 [Batillaria attramentaria]|uniref:Uncharacterized protein n=1 Tax=Batillaria attramentaria TaxID=370345 RepID=A0ABD0L4N4_9CAEN